MYVLSRNSHYLKIVSLSCPILLEIKKKNQQENMGVIKFYQTKIVNEILRKNIKNRLRKILELILVSDDDDPNSLMLALRELDRFRQELNNRYIVYLEKTQKEKLLMKLKIIEKDINDKLVLYQMNKRYTKKEYIEEEKEEVKHRSR